MNTLSFSDDELRWLYDVLENYTQVVGEAQARIYLTILEKLSAASPMIEIQGPVEPPRDDGKVLHPEDPYRHCKF